MKFSLVVGDGPNAGKAIPITKAQFLIGRDSKCHLRPASLTVSKNHCELQVRGDQFFVRDLKSSNGTFVNNHRIESEREVELKDGDALKLGPLAFTIRIEQTEAAAKPAPAPVNKPTPLPEKAKKSPEPTDEEAIATLLLAEDDQASEDSDIEGGSTIMQIVKPAAVEEITAQQPGKAAPYKPQSTRPSSAVPTSNAAKDILEKYRRRPKA